MRRVPLGVALCAAALATGCPGPKSPLKAEVLDYDHTVDQWRLATATLQTVEDLDALTGQWFDVVGNQLISINETELKQQDPDQLDTGRLQSLLLERRGERVQLSYDMIDDDAGDAVAMANDFESLAMLTTFHHFEKVWRFYRSDGCSADDVDGCVVQDGSAATREASLIGFYATVAQDVGINIPVLTSDNAAFVSFCDSFIVLRAQLLLGIPLFLNSGVIAHEFSHRVFHHNVYAGSAFANYYRKFVIDNIKSATPVDRRTFVLLKGLDEGCADINGVGFLRRQNFIADSLEGEVGEATRLQRDLEGAWADAVTYDSLKTGNGPLSPDGADLCATQDDDDDTPEVDERLSNGYTNTDWNFYCVGTLWARALWDASGRDVEVLRHRLLPALNRSLAPLGDDLAANWYFDFELIMRHLAAEVAALGDAALLDRLCAAFDDKFSSLMPVPPC
ncbi:MAG: hypothetical protein JXR83_08465 [Deltaproteobacteria bacterium]|nr:hypothetical protein [Deltaproteobacteria bacterium]